MKFENDFKTFLQALRAGDPQAAEELVRRHEADIRNAVRRRLADPRVGRLFESVDICQSIMAHFLEVARDGLPDFASPEDLRRYLLQMAFNNLRTKARHERPHQGDIPPPLEPAAADPSPSEVLIRDELVEAIRARLTPHDFRIFELRAAGHSWPEVADMIGGSPAALRMRHARAVAKLMEEGLFQEVQP